MSIEIKLPHLGENIPGGTILSIRVKAGQQVEIDEPLLEIETDKATLEVPSEIAGTIEKILVKEKDFVKVGQLLIAMSSSANVKAVTPEASPKKEAQSPITETKTAPLENTPEKVSNFAVNTPAKAEKKSVLLPILGDGVKSGKIISIHIKEGQQINTDDVLFDLETDKATLEVPSPYTGKILKLNVSLGQELKPGSELCVIETTGDSSSIQEPASSQSSASKNDTGAKTSIASISSETSKKVPAANQYVPPAQQTNTQSAAQTMPKTSGVPVPAAPTVRRFAFEIGIDIKQVQGSGPAGRITIEDVKKFSRELNTGARSLSGGAYTSLGSAQSVQLPDFSVYGPVRKEPMSKIREVTARHMAFCWNTVPQVTHTDKADITDIDKLRLRFKDEVESVGGKLTLTSILIKIVGKLLKQFPQFNASIDPANGQIIYKEYYSVGVAVDTPKGLLVPVIKDVEKKNIRELSVDLTTLSEKARTRKATPSDLSGSCMTITNLGGIGGTHFTPIVNWPDVAIVGVARGEWEPVLNNKGVFEPRLRLPICLSYDHRLIDGADAARFTRALCIALEDTLGIAHDI